MSTIKRSSATAELGEDGQSLRSLHTTFVAPVSHDAVDISVEVLRRGRSMSHLRAEVRNPAAARGHLTTAVFGSPRRGFEFTDLAPPAGFVPLELARSFRDPARGTGWTSLPSSRTGPSTRWP